MARRASSSDSQMITPFPAASPEALTTTGGSSSCRYPVARSASVKTPNSAVGTPMSRMSSLANAFEDSSCAAARIGPKIGRSRSSNRSTIPSASGTSGPTTVSSTRSSAANAARDSRSRVSTGTVVATASIPGLPGAAKIVPSGRSRRSLSAIACSRPPSPTTSSFTNPKGLARPWRPGRACGPRQRPLRP
jgi:hypothetical protein